MTGDLSRARIADRVGVAPSPRVRPVLVGVVAFLFFANVPFYLYVTNASPVPPWAAAGALILIGMVCARPPALAAMLRDPLVWWCCGVVVLSCVGLVVAPASGDAAIEFARRVLAAGALAMAFLAFRDGPTVVAVHRAVALGLILGAAINLYEVAQPLTFSNVLGRSAGLYVNPNISGGVLTAGAVVLAAGPRRWWVHPVLALASLGILTTLSRGALAVWFLCLALLVVGGRVRVAPLVGWLALAAALAAVAVRPISRAYGLDAGRLVELATGGRAGRLQFGAGASGGGDASIRLEVAREAWSMFERRPLLGHGIAATTRWDLTQSTHNTPLRGAAENGVAGLLVVPALILALAWGWSRRTKWLVLGYGAFLLGWSLLSHNLLEEWPFIVVSAYVAACTRRQMDAAS